MSEQEPYSLARGLVRELGIIASYAGIFVSITALMSLCSHEVVERSTITKRKLQLTESIEARIRAQRTIRSLQLSHKDGSILEFSTPRGEQDSWIIHGLLRPENRLFNYASRDSPEVIYQRTM